jgi:hypothetical protein
LSYSHSTGDFRFIAPSSNAAYGATAPSNPVVGQLWFDTGDSNTPTEDSAGLFVWDGYSWISCGTPITLPEAQTVTIDSSAAGAATINSFTAFQEIKTSDYISAGEIFEIPADVWIWSDDTSVAALIVDTDNATIVNNGNIIGRGGNAGGGGGHGNPGGPAISVTASGVTIDNASGAYIAGGGGGGARMGGGGAGGGKGGGGAGNLSVYQGGVGGAINASGQLGASNWLYGFAFGGGAGGGGGLSDENIFYAGGGGGRKLPGTSGSHSGGRSGLLPPVGTGGSAGNAGNNGTSQGKGLRAGGGGGWGASGGSSVSRNGGAGGAAVSGSYTQGTWDGTVYGSS